MPGWYYLQGHGNFTEVVIIAMKKILKGALLGIQIRYLTKNCS